MSLQLQNTRISTALCRCRCYFGYSELARQHHANTIQRPAQPLELQHTLRR